MSLILNFKKENVSAALAHDQFNKHEFQQQLLSLKKQKNKSSPNTLNTVIYLLFIKSDKYHVNASYSFNITSISFSTYYIC